MIIGSVFSINNILIKSLYKILYYSPMGSSSSSRGQKNSFKSTLTAEQTTALTCGAPTNNLLSVKMIGSALVSSVVMFVISL